MIDCINKALELLAKEVNPVQKICSSSAYWVPLQWLYVRMIENKDLLPLVKLPKEEKVRLWKIVSKSRPDKKEKWTRIMMCQSIYVYENI